MGFISRIQAFINDPYSRPADQDRDAEYNIYPDYETKVKELTKRYNASGEKYSLEKTAINYRVAWIAGGGIRTKSTDKATDDFIKQYFKWNRMHPFKLRQYVTIGEIEGKVLRSLVLKDDESSTYKIDGKGKRVESRILRFNRFKYTVVSKSDDYGEIEKITYKVDGKDKSEELKPGSFVFLPLYGLEDAYTETPSLVASVLYLFDNLYKAFRGLRAYNDKYPYPDLVSEATGQDATNTATWNFNSHTTNGKFDAKKGSYFAAAGTMKYIEPAGSGIEAFKEEAFLSARAISGATGVPIIFLGFVDLMSNRATATELPEMINASTTFERELWEESIKEEIIKAAALLGVKIQPDTITVSLPLVAMSFIELISKIFGDLEERKVISRETLREMIPGVDHQLEEERLKRQRENDSKETDKKVTELMNQIGNQNTGATNGTDNN